MSNKRWSVQHYFKRLSQMDWNGYFKAVEKAHEKSGKSRIFLFFDMVHSSVRYLAGYVDYNDNEFYLLNHQEKSTYLTLGQTFKIVAKYNDPKKAKLFDNKLLFTEKFAAFIAREHIDLRETDAQGLENFLKKHPQVMAKRYDDYVGRGITKIDGQNEMIDYEELYQKLLDERQYLIEEYFIQHERMNDLSPYCVNTLRMITFIDDEGNVHLLVAALKCGLYNFVDNVGQGAIYTVLDDKGTVTYPFVDHGMNQYTVSPVTGKDLIGFQVPYFDEIVAMLKKAALVVPEVRYIGWDVAVGPDQAELIEGNTSSRPFQIIPSFSENREGILPKYREIMDLDF